MSAAHDKKPWEQRDGEPDAAYARLLLYCHLGPGRSLDAAYALTASKRVKSRRSGIPNLRASGTWAADSSNWKWEARAKSWDVDQLADVGKAIVVKYVNALDLALGKVLTALHGKMSPRTWAQTIEALTILGSFIPQETVASIREDSPDDSIPAIGASSARPTGERPD